MRLGLKALDLKHWVHPDGDFEQFNEHKQDVIARLGNRCFAELPRSTDAQQEFSARLKEHLLKDHPAVFGLNGSDLTHQPSGLHWNAEDLSLSNSQYWVQEDICILQADKNQYRLTAASVCSPSNWALEEKIGRTVDEIHDPVPGYQDILAQRVNRLLSGLKAEKPMLRFNWSLQPGNELLWRNDLEAANGDTNTYWRVERQTLVKLPETDAVAFGIRIFLHPLDELGQGKSDIEKVASRLPQSEKTYKGLT